MSSQNNVFTSLVTYTDGRVQLVDDEIIAYTAAYSAAMTLINNHAANVATVLLNNTSKDKKCGTFSFKNLKSATYRLISVHPYRSVQYMEHLLILGIAAATHHARREGLIHVPADTPHKSIASFLPEEYAYDYKPNYHKPNHTLLISNDNVCMVVPKMFYISRMPTICADADISNLATLLTLQPQDDD